MIYEEAVFFLNNRIFLPERNKIIINQIFTFFVNVYKAAPVILVAENPTLGET